MVVNPNPERISKILEGLYVLPYSPMKSQAQLQVLRLVCSMLDPAKAEQQAQWLVDAMTSGAYNAWPGPGELRAMFCSKFKPHDGVQSASEVYPDGIPSEYLRIPGETPKKSPILLPPAIPPDPRDHHVSEDAAFDHEIQKAAERKTRWPTHTSEIVKLHDDHYGEAREPGTYRQITQADIDAELKKRKP